MSVKKYGWAIQKSLFAQTNQDSTFPHTRKNSKMFKVSKSVDIVMDLNVMEML